MTNAARFLDDLAARGRYHFAIGEAVAALGSSVPAVRAALRRLKAKGELADPFRGFYVVVPPEYRRLGCLPADQFVPQLFEHLGEPYYAALLSAAELHGAAHQRPQAFQVMLRGHRRAIACGAVRVQFVVRRDMERTPVIEKKTPRGPLRVATPEATALELVGYADQSGGLDHVAGVLSELAEMLDGEKLRAEAARSPVVWTQRLGYLLELVDRRALAEALLAFVGENAKFIAPLVRARSLTGALRDERWKLALNASIEPDL